MAALTGSDVPGSTSDATAATPKAGPERDRADRRRR
jgi:hypothetical protein